ncbi:homoserine O-acetyltransferase MetX [Halarchaeum sp. P4]|uniref:homoserine O-acetyltransferase MetX n=1 Tax=Halarchaeum sp. P4 TaxID=3421639 RepID=UPI003EBA2843
MTRGRREDVVNVGSFAFERGGELDLDVAYAEYGDPENPTVLVCHALTGSQYVAGPAPEGVSGQAAGWWDALVGPGKPIDTRAYHVVCANVPGSCYGTTGPASEGPDGEPYGPDFPSVTVGDWTRSQALLLDELGVSTLYAVVGGSVGGMNAIDWVKRYPERVERVAAIATSPRLDAQCLALNTAARRAITNDPNYDGGDYYGGPEPDGGLAVARRIGHAMYLSKASMRDRFGRRVAERQPEAREDPSAEGFPYRDVASYLDYNAERFTERFDANSYLYLLRALDEYDLAEDYNSDAEALANYAGDALVVSFTGDWHFPVDGGETIAEAFEAGPAAVSHRVVESEYGHDAFLVEPDRVGPPVRTLLEQGANAVTTTATRDTTPDYPRVCTGLLPDA